MNETSLDIVTDVVEICEGCITQKNRFLDGNLEQRFNSILSIAIRHDMYLEDWEEVEDNYNRSGPL